MIILEQELKKVIREEAKRILPDDFYYDFDELVSKAFSTEGIPSALLSF